jgi:hypothetical protein
LGLDGIKKGIGIWFFATRGIRGNRSGAPNHRPPSQSFSKLKRTVVKCIGMRGHECVTLGPQRITQSALLGTDCGRLHAIAHALTVLRSVGSVP